MNYVERHFGDWARDTAHLSMLEDGAYNRLVDLYYVREQPLPLDLAACCRLVRAVTKAERESVRSVLAEFFSNGPEGWTHKRCDIEIERFRSKSGKAKASANARWDAERAQSKGNADGCANALPTHNEGNATRGRGRARSHSPLPTSQTLHPEDAGSGPALRVVPPAPLPPFDGHNTETLNGKAVVCIAPEFELPDAWGFDAEALGFKPGDVLREAERFRQYWTAGKGMGTRRSVKGWRQSWSNWLAKAAERQQR